MTDRCQLNLRLDGRRDLLETIKQVAAAEGLSANAWVVRTLEQAVVNPSPKFEATRPTSTVANIEPLLNDKLDKVLDKVLDIKLDKVLDKVLDIKLDKVLDIKLDDKLDKVLDDKLDKLLDKLLDDKLDDKLDKLLDDKLAAKLAGIEERLGKLRA
jgi:hypothetical protein